MKKILIGSVASLFMASALVAAQGASSTSPSSPSEQSPSATSSASSSSQKGKTMSLTGCLVQGESASQYVLEDARTAAQSSSEPGARYVLARSGSSVDFSKNLNHKVTVTGTVEAAPAGGAGAMGASPSSSPSGSSSTSPSSSSSPEGQSSSSSPSSSSMGSQSSMGGQSASASGSQSKSTANLPTLSATNIVSISDSCTAE